MVSSTPLTKYTTSAVFIDLDAIKVMITTFVCTSLQKGDGLRLKHPVG